jgi:hypothetical protein
MEWIAQTSKKPEKPQTIKAANAHILVGQN